MKYDNLLRYLLEWKDYVNEVVEEDSYQKAINSKTIDPAYVEDLKPARKEYLEYIKEEETGCKLEECFEKWVKEYFDGDVYLDKTVDGKYADYEILKLWNAFKEGYEQKEREIKHEIQ